MYKILEHKQDLIVVTEVPEEFYNAVIKFSASQEISVEIGLAENDTFFIKILDGLFGFPIELIDKLIDNPEVFFYFYPQNDPNPVNYIALKITTEREKLLKLRDVYKFHKRESDKKIFH